MARRSTYTKAVGSALTVPTGLNSRYIIMYSYISKHKKNACCLQTSVCLCIYVEHCKYTTNLTKASGKEEIIIPSF